MVAGLWRWLSEHPIFSVVILAFFVWLITTLVPSKGTPRPAPAEPTQPPSVVKEVAPAEPSEHKPVRTHPPSSIDTGPTKGMSSGPELNRGSSDHHDGAGGDYGGSARTAGNLEVLSDTQGVDFGPYLSRVLQAVRMNWYNLIPEAARPPLLERGKVSIEFAILPDGKVAGMRIASPSGDVTLDRAAWGGITASNPFAPLPSEFHGPYLALRFKFYYNPAKEDMRNS